MGWTGRTIVLALAVTLLMLGGEARVEAYIDPGSASYVFQLLIGGLLGALFLVKTYWLRIRDSVRNSLFRVRRRT